MFLSNASVRRPVAMGCLIIGLTLLGLKSYRSLGLEMMPRVDIPYVTIVTVYPGASPEEIETDVAKRIEDAVVSIDGLKHVNSSCMENVCQTLLEFQLGVDVDIAATDVREKLDLISADLPAAVEDPKIQKFDINAKPVVTMALTGDVPLDELYDFADNTLRDRITVLPGVADAQLVGGSEREVHIQLDRGRLAARGLTSTDVVQAVRNNLGTIPAGRVRQHGVEYSVKFDADADRVSEIGRLEVSNEAGRRCYVRDLGRVEMATAELRQRATVDGRDCVTIKVVKKAEANAVAVVDAVRGAMDKLTQQLPGGMELVWVTDDGRFIEASNSSAWINVFEGVLLTGAILFLFLYNLRALLVVTITMPLTIVIGLFFMDLVGFTLNTSTLIAIGMSVGVLVTNSIVVLEAIVKRLNETNDPKESSRVGASEAFVAVLASAGTNVVVLFPLAMMGSMVGLFIRPLALTMFIMTVVSLFISFTLTPLLCSLLLRPRRPDARGWLVSMERGWNRLFDRLVEGYRRVLQFTEKHRWAAVLTILAVVGMLFQSLTLAGRLGSSMVSESDKGEVYVKVEYPTHYDLSRTVDRLREIERRLEGLRGLRHSLTSVGKVEGVIGQSSEGVYLAQMLLKFCERTERDETIEDLQREIRRRLAGYPEAVLTISVPSMVGGQNTPVELEIAGERLAVLDRLALKAQALSREIPGVKDPDTTVRPGKPELRVLPDRAILADMRYSAMALGTSLRGNLEGLDAGIFKREARNYDVVVKFAEEPGKDQVRRFLMPGAPGRPIVLETLAGIEEGSAPVQITRKDKRRVSKLLASLGPELPLGSAVQKIGDAIHAEGGLPPGYNITFAGMYEMMGEGQAGLADAGLVSIVLVFLTLAAILESFKQPLLIFVTLPLALIGMIWALAWTGESLGIFAIMGGVMMIGIVVNNAILIMDQFNVHVLEGAPRHGAMIRAACERFRPIVMITLAAVLGMLPLAAGRGIGAEMRNGVGIASVGGILVSGVLTLLVMPILYDLFTRKNGRKREPQTPPDSATM
jgi:hydrophobic/amphiphilic exporter-1 (mainly G- bacteria), HAE1 family